LNIGRTARCLTSPPRTRRGSPASRDGISGHFASRRSQPKLPLTQRGTPRPDASAHHRSHPLEVELRTPAARGRSRPPTQVGSAPRPRSALALGHRARSPTGARPVRSGPSRRRRHLNRRDPGARPLPADHPGWISYSLSACSVNEDRRHPECVTRRALRCLPPGR
jgi:hypothetical protein